MDCHLYTNRRNGDNSNRTHHKYYKDKNDADEGHEGPGSGSRILEVKVLAKGSSHPPPLGNVDNPVLAGDVSRRCGVEIKKETPVNGGKGAMDHFWKLMLTVNAENSADLSGEYGISTTRRSCRLRQSQLRRRSTDAPGQTQTFLEYGTNETGRNAEDFNDFDMSVIKQELMEGNWLSEVEDLESVIKDELQTTAAAADWSMPTTVTRSQKTVLESRRKGRNGKQSGIRHERGGGRRGRGRGRRQGKNGGKGDATKIITAAGYRKQSSDLVKQKLSIDSESEEEASQVLDASEKVKGGPAAKDPSSSSSKQKTFQCSHCMKFFMTQNNLTQHAKWMHGANRPLSQPSLWFFQSQCNTVAHAVAALMGTAAAALTSPDRKPSSDGQNCPTSDEKPVFDPEPLPTKGQVQCLTCQEVFKTNYSLLVHSRMHTGQKLFSCSVCDQKFITKGHLTKHDQHSHGDRRSKSSADDDDTSEVVCTEDNVSVVSLSGLALAECDIDGSDTLSLPEIPDANSPSDARPPLSPVNVVDNETADDTSECKTLAAERTDKCGRAKNSRRSERKHIPVVPSKIQIECNVCGKVFTTKYSLLIHGRIHTGEKPYPCDVCSQRFYTSSHLVTHRRVHTGEKPYKCKDCGRSFSSSNPLRRHQQSFHSTLRPYVCEYCAKTFKFKDNLRLHIARRHSTKKQVKCAVCDLMFTDRKQARRHEQLKHRKKTLSYEELSYNGEYYYQCGFCNATFMDLNEIKQHSIDAHELDTGDIDSSQMPVHPFKCNICGKAYVWRGGLREHMLKHSGERQFECKICSKRFFSREVLRRHSITHTDARPFACTICTKRFKSKGVLSKHAVRFHFGEKEYSCEVCGKQFFTATELKTHKSFHTDEKLFVCNICDAHLKTQMSLKRHQISHGERRFSCQTCSRQFFTELHLKRHELIHTGQKPFNCYICAKQFYTKKNLGRHMALHGEKKYSCETCQKKFVSEMDKRIHEALHLGKKPFGCHLCSRSFNAKKTLKRHLCLHDEEKRYSCQFCGHVYSSGTELECHERIHTGEKPFECPICNEKFRVKVNLKRHLHRHGGEKRYECELCGKKFLLRQYLRQHVRSHAGAKPYTCCTCNKQYVWRRDLMIHYRKCRTGVYCPEDEEMHVNS